MLLGATSFWGTQGQTTTPQQNQQRVQATPLPPDIDPSDPALASLDAQASSLLLPSRLLRPPTCHQGNRQGQIPGSEVGAVTKNGDRYTFRSQVNEVTLSATVLDSRRHLVTNLAETNFAVYEDNQPQKITSFRRRRYSGFHRNRGR